MNRPSPNASKAATPALLTLKTPQRSILKAENGNSIIKKRRVVFASDDENGSESSSSEMMEVEVSLKVFTRIIFMPPMKKWAYCFATVGRSQILSGQDLVYRPTDCRSD